MHIGMIVNLMFALAAVSAIVYWVLRLSKATDEKRIAFDIFRASVTSEIDSHILNMVGDTFKQK